VTTADPATANVDHAMSYVRVSPTLNGTGLSARAAARAIAAAASAAAICARFIGRFYFFSTFAAVIAFVPVLVPFTSTLMPFTTPAHVVSSTLVVAVVVTVVDPIEKVNAGQA